MAEAGYHRKAHPEGHSSMGSPKAYALPETDFTMTAKSKFPQKYQKWIDARKRFHLSDAHMQMARELGMNPEKFGKISNNRQEPWKMPLPDYIEELYFKRFGKRRPEIVKPIERVYSQKRSK